MSAIILAVILPIFGQVEAAAPVKPDPLPAGSKVSYTEAIRTREVTQSDFNSSTTRSQTTGSYSFQIELTGNFSDLSPASELSITLGRFVYKGTLGDDPAYKTGRNSANLGLFLTSDSSVKTAAFTIQAKWSKDRVTIKTDGKVPSSESPIASGVSSSDGKFSGRTQLSIRFGSVNSSTPFDFTGNLRRKEYARGDLSGSETNIEVKGKI
jgi:hypothetical protein